MYCKEFAIRTWTYQVIQYSDFVQVGNTNALEKSTTISFAATFLTRTAAA